MSATLLRIIDESVAGDFISEIAVSFASPSVTVQDIIAARSADATPDKPTSPSTRLGVAPRTKTLGDRTLSRIISKAVPLAEDHMITDKVILSQIRRRKPFVSINRHPQPSHPFPLPHSGPLFARY